MKPALQSTNGTFEFVAGTPNEWLKLSERLASLLPFRRGGLSKTRY